MVNLYWDKGEYTRIVLLEKCGLNKKLAGKKWSELDAWIREKICEDIKKATNNTVTVTN